MAVRRKQSDTDSSETIRLAVRKRMAELGWTINKLHLRASQLGSVNRAQLYEYMSGTMDMSSGQVSVLFAAMGVYPAVLDASSSGARIL